MTDWIKTSREPLRVIWSEKNHYIDLFEAHTFEEECENVLDAHDLYWPSNERDKTKVKFIKSVQDNKETLDYKNDLVRDENVDAEIDLGVMIITFTDRFRSTVDNVVWIDEDGREWPNAARTSWDIAQEDSEEFFREGKAIYRTHLLRERNPKIVNRAKEIRLKKDPLLECDICGFSFVEKYGSVGKGFIEAHHLLPLSQNVDENEIKVEDLALVCSNCHRMLHRYRPWLGIGELKTILKSKHQ